RRQGATTVTPVSVGTTPAGRTNAKRRAATARAAAGRPWPTTDPAEETAARAAEIAELEEATGDRATAPAHRTVVADRMRVPLRQCRRPAEGRRPDGPITPVAVRTTPVAATAAAETPAAATAEAETPAGATPAEAEIGAGATDREINMRCDHRSLLLPRWTHRRADRRV